MRSLSTSSEVYRIWCVGQSVRSYPKGGLVGPFWTPTVRAGTAHEWHPAIRLLLNGHLAGCWACEFTGFIFLYWTWAMA